MRELETVLAEHPLFKDMSPKYLEVVVGCASNARFEHEEIIFREGEAANSFYLIREGKVSIEAFHLERGNIILQTLGAGDVLGWSWLVPPYRWRFDARSLERTRAFKLDGQCLRGKCDEDPRLGYELLQRFASVLEQRLQATRVQLMDLYSTGV